MRKRTKIIIVTVILLGFIGYAGATVRYNINKDKQQKIAQQAQEEKALEEARAKADKEDQQNQPTQTPTSTGSSQTSGSSSTYVPDYTTPDVTIPSYDYPSPSYSTYTPSSTPTYTSTGPSAATLEAQRQERIQSCLRILGQRGAGGSSAAQQCYTIR